MNTILRKKLKQIARANIKDDVMVFRNKRVRVGFEWKECFILVATGKAHFYMVDSSDTKLQFIESGKESSEPIMKGMFLDNIVKNGDRLVPVIDGKVGGLEGDMLLEVMAKPLSPSMKGIHYEAPLKAMDLSYKIVDREGSTYLEIKE
ncbi:hypothetical protein K7T73_15435 [Bacillus badius]|uniref:hypothetical protein n=1 Tax=Bacillus badius TaxID=1455 RepID=UPI0005974455|nr:hypothetical protein [Bacillus badius]KIL71946.1 hypothetical protein SD78_1251 [Bacillus badius]UAT29939.1 hypothetical protein K7T73_15435 [Bacillus badius]